MAEFCLKHFNEMLNKQYSEKDVKLSNDFCESCGEWTKCVVYIKEDFKLKNRVRWKLYSLLEKFNKD